MSFNNTAQIDPRKPDRIKRYKTSYSLQFGDDQLQEYMNVLGMIFSMCGLMMKVSEEYFSAYSGTYFIENLI
jgi:hypothetical protein